MKNKKVKCEISKKQHDYRLLEAMRASAALPQMSKFKGGDGNIANWKTNFHTPALDECFKELRIVGWVAEKDWACCGTCGHKEMESYFGKEKPYVFYTQQGAEHLNESGRVYLNHGAYGLQRIKKARQLFKTLEDYNLKPEWDGMLDTSMKITMPEGKLH